MANRGSRKRARNPELRTSKTGRRSSRESRAATQSAGPPLRVRPDGARGVLAMVVGALPTVALVLAAGYATNRWFSWAWPDSLWLSLAFALVAAAPAVGYVARAARDVVAYVAVGSALVLVALLVELSAAPGTCHGDDCAPFGALGAWGIVGSLVVVALCAGVAWWLGDWLLSFVEGRRSDAGRRTFLVTALTMLFVGVLLGIPLGATLLGIDALVRDEPGESREAREVVAQFCFSDFAPTPELDVRPDPTAQVGFRHSYLVHRGGERRLDVDGKKLPSDFPGSGEAHPYEALVAFDGEGEPVTVECRKVAPRSGLADAHDREQADIASELGAVLSPNPGAPPFLQQAGGGFGGLGGASAPITVS